MYTINSKSERLRLNFLQNGEEMDKFLFYFNKSDYTN